MGAEDHEPDPDVRARIDAQVEELRRTAEGKGLSFSIVEQSPTQVAYETWPPQGWKPRRLFVVSVDDGRVQVEERPHREYMRDLEVRRSLAQFKKRHQGVIDSLEQAGHRLEYSTRFESNDDWTGGGSYSVSMRCERCGSRYFGSFVGRFWGLSPNRPCPGESG